MPAEVFYKPSDGWVADVIPFYWDGAYHLFYLKDYREDPAEFAAGAVVPSRDPRLRDVRGSRRGAAARRRRRSGSLRVHGLGHRARRRVPHLLHRAQRDVPCHRAAGRGRHACDESRPRGVDEGSGEPDPLRRTSGTTRTTGGTRSCSWTRHRGVPDAPRRTEARRTRELAWLHRLGQRPPTWSTGRFAIPSGRPTSTTPTSVPICFQPATSGVCSTRRSTNGS